VESRLENVGGRERELRQCPQAETMDAARFALRIEPFLLRRANGYEKVQAPKRVGAATGRCMERVYESKQARTPCKAFVRAWPGIVRKAGVCLLALLAALAFCGCAWPSSTLQEGRAAPGVGAQSPLTQGAHGRPEIQDVYLSPGDEIRISVYGHPNLTRQIVIDPNGSFFFPLVGWMNVTGESVRQLRQDIATRLGERRDYAITPGDEISVKVYRHEELSFQGIVPHNGIVLLPLAGEAALSGMTLAQAGQAVSQKLSPFVQKPNVTVQVLRYQGPMPIGDPQVSVDLLRLTGEKFFVLGEVRTPGVFALSGSVQLMDAIAAAGGLRSDAAKGSVVLIRPGGTHRKAEATRVDLDQFLKGGDLAANPRIGRGDIVYVPETAISKAGRFFRHVADIVRPFVDIETGIWLGQNIEEGPSTRGATTVVLPSRP
jgi:polysaccharide biosynthesis/export protein